MSVSNRIKNLSRKVSTREKGVIMNKKLSVFMIIALLAGTAIGYSVSIPQVSKLQSEISKWITDYNSLHGSLIKYFFIEESNFTVPLNESIWWGMEAWHSNPDSVCEIKNGTLHLFYNGTIDYSYGNSGVFQGKHTDGRFTHQLLVGDSPENAFYGDYVVFPKNIQSGEFLLKTKFRIRKMGFTLYPVNFSHPNYSRVNLGITLMCALNNEPFNLTAKTLWLDVYFAGYCINETHIWTVPENWNYTEYPDDIHAGCFVGEVHPQEFGKWIMLSIDLGDYISKTLNLITQVDIKTIRVYGFIVFVECLGAYAEVEYDYVSTATIGT
jgi:hypothetical protein